MPFVLAVSNCVVAGAHTLIEPEGLIDAVGIGLTVSVTTLEVIVPQAPVTMHLYCLPLIAVVTAVRFKVAKVALGIFAKLPELLSCH